MPTTVLKAWSAWPALVGSASLTLASTAELRTWGVIGPIRDPETATPRAQATSSTASADRKAPPTASTARAGCQVILSRTLAPAYWSIAWPMVADRMTMKSAPRDTHSEGAASPRACGASQMPNSPPSSSPIVANAPVTKPCQ